MCPLSLRRLTIDHAWYPAAVGPLRTRACVPGGASDAVSGADSVRHALCPLSARHKTERARRTVTMHILKPKEVRYRPTSDHDVAVQPADDPVERAGPPSPASYVPPTAPRTSGLGQGCSASARACPSRLGFTTAQALSAVLNVQASPFASAAFQPLIRLLERLSPPTGTRNSMSGLRPIMTADTMAQSRRVSRVRRSRRAPTRGARNIFRGASRRHPNPGFNLVQR
ncbi:hypothetical protein B0H15DRAFT_819726 [Mycena belliarum]|uniref:Uncharacterized protein n=1 Tax=Mycena belliarum TaxID=1033014 RepID=A0AAD6XS16_9AGAR|nr:hypothetical protein B0H15DRAFT_819726 [Mycena belliae]